MEEEPSPEEAAAVLELLEGMDPEINDINVGRCFGCGQLWCCACDQLFAKGQLHCRDCAADEDEI